MARQDHAIYIWSTPSDGRGHVRRYEPESKQVESTAFKSICFSPTGKYYFVPVGVNGRHGVFRSADNSEVANSPGMNAITPFSPIAWSPDTDTLLVRSSRQGIGEPISVDEMLLDLDTDVAWTISSRVTGWAGSRAQLMATDGDRTRVVDVESVATRLR
jgi:hypothetical protein